MPREVDEYYADVHPAARNLSGPQQQLHYYNERRHPRGAYFANRFDRGDMGPAYYPHESWLAAGRPYFPRPEFELGPGSPVGREAYGISAGLEVHQPHRTAYRRHDADDRDYRSADGGARDGSVEREHGQRKRRHHKSSKHRHRRSRHHRRHKRAKRSEIGSDGERGNELPSLTLGAEISRGRQCGGVPVTRTSAPESDISDDGSQSVGERSDSVRASDTLSPSAVPVAYSGYDVENDKDEAADTAACREDRRQSTEEGEEYSSDAESESKKSRSSTSSSESDAESPTAVKHKTRNQQVAKVRSSYATALAAKLRQNRLALEERSCRRPDTSTPRLQPADGSPSVIEKSLAANAETSRLCSDSNPVTANSLNVEQVTAVSKQLETVDSSSVVSCSTSAAIQHSSRLPSVSAVHHEIPTTTTSLNWYVLL